MEVLVSTTKLILVLHILYLYYEVYPGLTELILVLQSLFLSFGYRSTRRYYRTFCWNKSTRRYYRTASLYRGTRRYYRTYTYSCISDLILVFRILYSDLIRVLRNLYLSYRTYMGLTELILVFRSTYWYFGSYTCITGLICISNLIHVIQNLYLSYGTYIGLTEHILILRILSLCEGTRRYNKSELIIIVSHTRSDQMYADTYQVWTLVHSRYKS